MQASSPLGNPLRRWRQWRNLIPADRTALVLFAGALPAIDVGLRLFGYRRTRGLLDQLSRRDGYREPTAAEITRAERLARIALIAGRRGAVRASCLRQALALNAWLRHKGLSSEIRLGIAPPDDNGFNAHAWVELGGVALGENGPPRHVAFKLES